MNTPCDVELRDDCPREQQHDLFVQDVDGTGRIRLTDLPGAEEAPVFSPDGRRIVFLARVGDHRDLHVVDAAGGNVRRLTAGYSSPGNLRFTPDGTAVAFTETRWDEARDGSVKEPHAVGLDGSVRTVTGTPPPEAGATPDWSRFAYTAGPVNAEDVYVRDAGAAEGRRLTNLAAEPALDPAADEL
jgi:dipeptidyl aminopeptidase/acylaminoacyl peptidase